MPESGLPELPSFEAFMLKKKVHLPALQAARPIEFARAAAQYAALGPVSFDQQAKFQFNDWRLDFPLPAPPKEEQPTG
jgi:hypothetical protein